MSGQKIIQGLTEALERAKCEQAKLVTVEIFEGSYLSRSVQGRVEDTIARAILSAKAEERDDIWAIASGNAVGERELERLAREAGDAEGCLLHALLARENEQIAAAIRKRGEG